MMRMLPTLAIWMLVCTVPALAEVRLVMVEQPGCQYCLRWNAEAGGAYAKTAEGRIAPLHRVQLRGDLPEGVTFLRPAIFTPTFVLVNDGAEVDRIEGYPGEHFFWPLLSQLIEQLPADLRKDPGS